MHESVDAVRAEHRLNESPPKRKGNLRWLVRACSANLTLNESPSEKEGKSRNESAC